MIKRHTISFKNAFNGLKYAFLSQPNYKIHLFLSLIAVFGGIFFKISYNEFLIIISLIFIGFTIETTNTAIEETNDAIDKSLREDIRLAKDTSSAAMLIFAIGAFFISSIIFIPKIIFLINK